ncbi:hypothetical protein FJY63_10440, partial [Candidatus Sumerlaeota bacterium]|nr:hypothetical protein [Candidatus Sumerlaeota bacterium]
MTRKTDAQAWNVVAFHRTWGCLTCACFLALIAAIGFVLLIWLVRPRRGIDPLTLIHPDVDGLILIELSRSSQRVNTLVQALIQPLSYEVQSHPEQLQQQISQMLDVVTFRRAICLLSYDTARGQEQWACVVPLKRMGDWLKVMVKQMAEREPKSGLRAETSGGVLLLHGKGDRPSLAVERRALVIASNPQWLATNLSRIRNPLIPTERATQLYAAMPHGGKHCIARASILLSPQRWYAWPGSAKGAPPLLAAFERVRQLLEQCNFRPPQVELIAAAASVQPNQQMRFDLTVKCREDSLSAAL